MVRDAKIEKLVSALREDLQSIPERSDYLLGLARQGISPGQACGMTEAEYAALCNIARALCDAGDFHSALPVALQLVLHSGGSARFAALAGECLQGLSRPKEAQGMFALALKLDTGCMEALYRLADCLHAEGRTQDAIDTFRALIEQTAGIAKHARVRATAIARIAALRHTRH